MAREFTGTIPFEIMGVEVIAEVLFTATPFVPATYDDPSEGGEIEVIDVQSLYTETWNATATPPTKTRTDLDCPDWLEKIILEQAQEETNLLEQADFDDGPDE